MKMMRWLVALLAVMVTTHSVTAQGPLRMIWNQERPMDFQETFTAALAASYQYTYRVGSNAPVDIVKKAVTCTTTNNPAIKACETQWTQPMPPAGTQVVLTASDGLNVSPASLPYTAPSAPNAPTGLRIQAWLARLFSGINSSIRFRR